MIGASRALAKHAAVAQGTGVQAKRKFLMSRHPNRREFLEYLTVIGSALLPGIANSPDAVADSGRGCNARRVVILGGGLAGLTAAYKLMNQRYEVIVLEGQDRVGGRVLTVRNGFKGSGHAEMGATRIFSTHTATIKYVELFGLGPLVPYDSGSRAFYIRERRFMPPPAGQPWPIADMSDAEKANPFAFLGPIWAPASRSSATSTPQVGRMASPRPSTSTRSRSSNTC